MNLLGSITSLSNSTGSLTGTYSYDSFANSTSSSGGATNPFQYTAREFDSETGLYYYRARYYDAGSGRFLSEDPIGFNGGANWYRYVTNNPLAESDPTGFCPVKYPGARNGTGRQSWVDCVRELGNKGGLQNLTHAGNGFLANAILSNSVSSVIELVQDLSRVDWSATAHDSLEEAVEWGPHLLLEPAAELVPNVTVTVTTTALTVTPEGITVASTSASGTVLLGDVAQAGAKFAVNLLDLKVIYDMGVALGAAQVCSRSGIR